MNQNDVIQNLLNKVTQEIYANVQLSALIKENESKIEKLEKEIQNLTKNAESEDAEWKKEK